MKQDDWQPIETAPKDGVNVLLLVGGKVDIGWWRQGSHALRAKPVPCWRYRRSLSVTYDRAHPPTHWMPLPEPPNPTPNEQLSPSRARQDPP